MKIMDQHWRQVISVRAIEIDPHTPSDVWNYFQALNDGNPRFSIDTTGRFLAIGSGAIGSDLTVGGLVNDASVEHRAGTTETAGTTPATTASVLEITPATAATYTLFAQFAAAQHGSLVGGTFIRAAGFRVDPAGVVTRLGSPTKVSTFTEGGLSENSVDIDTDGTKIRFRVTGLSAAVDW